jgi:hypothetical protein
MKHRAIAVSVKKKVRKADIGLVGLVVRGGLLKVTSS